MTPLEHLDLLQEESGVLRRVAGVVDLDADVPTCPEWRVRDLMRHLGGIHRWATTIVSEPRIEPWIPNLEQVEGGWPPDEVLATWLAGGLDRLIDTLRNADDELDCFAPLPADSAKAMWCRRQLHETTIHRFDLECAHGDPSIISAAVADDGIDELLTVFVTRRRSGLDGISGEARFAVRTTDTNRNWVVRTNPAGVETTRESIVDTTGAGISGCAADLYLALWNRLGPDKLTSSGNGDFLGAWNQTVHVRYG